MVAPPLSQQITQETHRKYTISIGKNLAVVAQNGLPGLHQPDPT